MNTIEITISISSESNLNVKDFIKPIFDAVHNQAGGAIEIIITPKEKMKVKLTDLTNNFPKSNYTINIKK
jgi:hypothetical protein